MQVLVRDNNVDQALKALKKKMQREGIFREMKLRGHYEKPSEKRAREKAEAVRRARKLARKKMQREGLLPMKPKPVPAPADLVSGRDRCCARLPIRPSVRLSDGQGCRPWRGCVASPFLNRRGLKCWLSMFARVLIVAGLVPGITRAEMLVPGRQAEKDIWNDRFARDSP